MYINEGEPTEKCGDLNFGLEYDFATQTLKLKIIQVRFWPQFDIWQTIYIIAVPTNSLNT